MSSIVEILSAHVDEKLTAKLIKELAAKLEALAPKKRASKKEKKEKDPKAPKRPMTAYLLFSQKTFADNKAGKVEIDGNNQAEKMRAVALMWKALAAYEKAPYEKQAEEAKKDYAEAVEKYKSGEKEEVEKPKEKEAEKPKEKKSESEKSESESEEAEEEYTEEKLNKMKVNELKKICTDLELETKGKKADLVARILESQKSESEESENESEVEEAEEEYTEEKLNKMKVDELKKICTDLELETKGKKADLVARILESQKSDDE